MIRLKEDQVSLANLLTMRYLWPTPLPACDPSKPLDPDTLVEHEKRPPDGISSSVDPISFPLLYSIIIVFLAFATAGPVSIAFVSSNWLYINKLSIGFFAFVIGIWRKAGPHRKSHTARSLTYLLWDCVIVPHLVL